MNVGKIRLIFLMGLFILFCFLSPSFVFSENDTRQPDSDVLIPKGFTEHLSVARTADIVVENISPETYPSISPDEMAQLRYVLHLADRDLLDFSDMEGIDQEGMTAYRYQIAFMTYFMALEQYHKLPACPEIIQPRMDRLIQKIIRKPVWDFWAEVSRGLEWLEPYYNKPYPEERDPVVFRNIMYSGHLGHMVGLYEMLYHDYKYDEPGSITFAWSEDEKYEYDHYKLNKVMHDQMAKLPQRCVECEPNACFPECNQHPILSFMLHDHLHGTDMYKASEKFMDFFLEKKMIHPRTHETAMVYLIKQDITMSSQTPRYGNAADMIVYPAIKLNIVSIASASADGWTGAFMHAWQPEFIERHYPFQREYQLVGLDDEQARLKRTIWEPQLRYGFFAIYAAEMGDFETRDRLIAFADDKYDPVRQDGMMRYPANDSKGLNNLTGHLIAMARATPEGGLYTMHNQPLDDAHFKEPMVTNVDFPNVLLRRAIYDREKKALIVTTAPGMKNTGTTTLTIVNLDPSISYRLTVDGKETQNIKGREKHSESVGLQTGHDLVLIEI
jgi:hypothetical protein